MTDRFRHDDQQLPFEEEEAGKSLSHRPRRLEPSLGPVRRPQGNTDLYHSDPVKQPLPSQAEEISGLGRAPRLGPLSREARASDEGTAPGLVSSTQIPTPRTPTAHLSDRPIPPRSSGLGQPPAARREGRLLSANVGAGMSGAGGVKGNKQNTGLPLLVIAGGGGLALLGLVAWLFWPSAEEAPEAIAELPLIMPAEGPAKIKPEDEGGAVIEHQDKDIFETMDGRPPANGSEEVLRPGPETPISIPRPQDSSAATPAAGQQMPRLPGEAIEPAPLFPSNNAGSEPPPPAAPVPPIAAASPLTEGGLPALPPLPAASTAPAAAPEALPPVGSEAVPVPIFSLDGNPVAPAVINSPQLPPLPPTRPAPQTPQTAAVVPLAPVVPETVPSTDRGISGAAALQLVSVRSAEGARAAITQMRSRNSDLLGRLNFEIRQIDLGGGRGFTYRVLAGPFPSRETAARVCESLKARRQDCIVVKP